MKRLVLSVFVVACFVAAAFVATREVSTPAFRAYTQHESWIEFIEYMKEFGKAYENEQELMVRFGIYIANKAKIEHHNSLKKNWTMAINDFADLTQKEFETRMLNSVVLKDDELENLVYEDFPPTTLTSIDWQKKGYTTGVKNQNPCESCWAFSTTGVMECWYKKKTGQLIPFSEKQLMSCSGAYGNGNCNTGGLPESALNYVKKYGIEKGSDYPYVGKAESCKYDARKIVTRVNGFSRVSASESALKSALANGAMSVVVDASTWQHYGGGIMHPNECGNGFNHAVTAIGFGVENGVKFFRIKNSWATWWGEKGFVRLESKDGSGKGTCAVAQRTVYPNF